MTTRKDITIADLPAIAMQPLIRFLRRWWLQRVENHYLMSASTEAQRAKEAQLNSAYFQKRAAHARADLNKMRRGIYE